MGAAGIRIFDAPRGYLVNSLVTFAPFTSSQQLWASPLHNAFAMRMLSHRVNSAD